jgi:UTP-glucose-1-phosphate uridylyltransferase
MNQYILDPKVKLCPGATLRGKGKEFVFTDEAMNVIRKEIQSIKERFYDYGEVSELMKSMVDVIYHDDELSPSGYWIRAATILERYNQYLQ